MAYSYFLFRNDPNDEYRQIALVRKEVDDRTDEEEPKHGEDYFQEDEDILASLGTAREEAPSDANNVEILLMACASTLDTLATNQAFVLKKQRTLADETDGPAVAKEIRSHAAALRARVKASITDRRTLAALEASRVRRVKKPTSGGVKIQNVF